MEIITPTITLTSAVEEDYMIFSIDVIVMVFTYFLFSYSHFQRFGTKKIGSLFGPAAELMVYLWR